MENETIKYLKLQIADRMRHKESLEQSAVMIRSKAAYLATNLIEAANEFKKEIDDLDAEIKEEEIRMQREKDLI